MVTLGFKGLTDFQFLQTVTDFSYRNDFLTTCDARPLCLLTDFYLVCV